MNRSAIEKWEILWRLSILSTFLQHWVIGGYLIRAADIMCWWFCTFGLRPHLIAQFEKNQMPHSSKVNNNSNLNYTCKHLRWFTKQLVVQDVFRISENTPVSYLRKKFFSQLKLRGFPNFGYPVTSKENRFHLTSNCRAIFLLNSWKKSTTNG